MSKGSKRKSIDTLIHEGVPIFKGGYNGTDTLVVTGDANPVCTGERYLRIGMSAHQSALLREDVIVLRNALTGWLRSKASKSEFGPQVITYEI